MKKLIRNVLRGMGMYAYAIDMENKLITVFKKGERKEFYRQFIPHAFKRNWLRFFMLSINGDPCAIQIGYVYNGIYHALQEGFNPTIQQGIGNLLRKRAIEQLIEEGIEEYDFLGGFTQHKARWQAKKRAGIDIFISNNNLKNIAFRFKTIWPKGRFLKQK